MNVQKITDIQTQEQPRIATGLANFDEFLGGGFVLAQIILLAGTPGAGKSTAILQLATVLADRQYKILYFSGEENLNQIKLRANRLHANRPNIWLSDITELTEIKKAVIKIDPQFIIIDSLQTIHTDTLPREAIGSPKQLEECLENLRTYIKQTNYILIFIGHSTKTGEIRGALTIQHMVDSTFFIQVKNKLRTLHSIKNRFGPTETTFLLTMKQNGFSELNTHATAKKPHILFTKMQKLTIPIPSIHIPYKAVGKKLLIICAIFSYPIVTIPLTIIIFSIPTFRTKIIAWL